MTKPNRGSALLTVLIVLLVITALGAGMIALSGKNLSNSKLRETSVGLSSCAQAVRSYIGSQVAAKNAIPNLNFSVPGTSAPITMQGGHYDAIDVTSFKLPSPPPYGQKASSSIENLANALPLGIGVTLKPTVGSAICTDSAGRVYEVEFSFISG